MHCGANLTSPGLSVHSGALVLVLICVHHVLLVILLQAVEQGKAEHLITYVPRFILEVHMLVFV